MIRTRRASRPRPYGWLLLTILPVLAIWSQASALTIAYVVNSDTLYSNLTYDRPFIDFFKNDMGYTVKVITDDSASHITTLGAYGGYFLSATITSANLANIDTTSRGVFIADQLLYGTFRVASGQTALTSFSSLTLNRLDSLHFVTRYMFNKIVFSLAAGNSFYAYTGLPSGATVLFTPSNKNWNGETGSPDTAFCYTVDTGGTLTSGTAQGRRVVGLPFYGLLTQSTDYGWCHPKELLGNLCGWVWGDSANVYNSRYNCYSTDVATDPGPEINEAWAEYGANYRYIYYNGRIGVDGRPGLMFLQSRYWSKKAMAGFEPDSFKVTYTIPYRGYGVDAPPVYADTITLTSIISSTRMLFDTTTLASISMYNLHYGGTGKAYLLRSGSGSDTTQKGDTINLGGGTRNGRNDTLYYSLTSAGFFNGTTSSQVRLSIGDAYGGFDFWLKMYAITPTTVWNAPLASANQGGNPEGSATRTWINRNFIKSGNTDSVRWSATDLVAGVDHPEAAVDSFRFNRTTFTPDGLTVVDFVLPGSYLNNDNFNWLVFKSIDVSDGADSTDVEIIPQTISNVRGSFVQKFEMWLSTASPQTLGVDDTTMTFSGEVGGTIANQINWIRNTGDGTILIDSIVVSSGAWLDLIPDFGITPQGVLYTVDTDGLSAGVDTALVTIYAATATNTPLTTYAIITLTSPPVEAPPATVPKRTGLRLQ